MALAIALFGHLEMPSAATAAPSQIAASVPRNHDGRPHKGLSHDGIPANGRQCADHAHCVFPAILPGAPILPYLLYRKSAVRGTGVSVRVDPGCPGISKKKNEKKK